MLSPKEIAHYHETGQVTPDYRLGDDVISAVEQRMEALFTSRPDLDPNFADSLIEIDKSWLGYAAYPDILDAVAQLLGNDIIVWASNFFCKKGKGGKETPWHQDGRYWPIRPLTACTVWIAIDQSTPENGCSRIIPGSHRERRLFEHEVDSSDQVVLEQTLSATSMPAVDPVNVVPEPGMMSFRDVYTIHGAEPNESGTRRAGLTFRYMPMSSYYDRELATELGGLPQNPFRELHLVRGIDVCGRNDIYRPRD